MSSPSITDHLPISIRAFAVPDAIETGKTKKRTPRSIALAASNWTLIFDCETFADETQSLRFGTYQIRNEGALMESGLFYSPENLSDDEIAVLRNYASSHGLELLTHAEFVEHVFFRIGYDYRGTIVGFNLPFDIARIALNADSARGKMKGGFTFGLTENKKRPRIQIKHLSARAAFIQFAAPGKNRSNPSVLKRGKTEPIQRGHFVDCKTLSSALLAKSFSLTSLCQALGLESAKLKFEDFNAPVTPEFVQYAVRDTQATWECYCTLIAKFDKLGLDGTRPEKIYSEASLGKALSLIHI